MPTFEFTSPEGKKYVVNGPEGATKEQAFGILQQQLGAAPAATAPTGGAAAIPGASPAQQAAARAGMAPKQDQEDTLLGKIVSPIDTGLAAISGAVTPIVAVPGGFIKSMYDEKVNGVVRSPQENAQIIANRIQYKPVTATARKALEAIGEAAPVLEALPGMAGELSQLGRATAASAGNIRELAGASAAAQNAADAAAVAKTGPSLRDMVRAPRQLSGGGAADVAQATQRATRAESLPVPIKLTKGQLTRNREQVAFERETAKQKEGAPLASNYENQNAQFGQNLDLYAEETGAQNISRTGVGKSVVNALDAKNKAKLNEIRGLYDKARTAGEMSEPVDVTSLTDWVAKNKGKDKLAPIVTAIENELKQNARTEGGGIDNLTLAQRPTRTIMSLEASEDLRQAINKLAEPGTPNVVYGKEAQNIIDAAQEGKGGDLFRQARRAYENYSNEFSNRNVVDQLLRFKPNSKDRAVAYEDVFRNTIMNGSNDDVRHILRVLEAHPAGTDPAVVAAGQQAAKDLRGAVINHIKDEMQKNLNVDSTGARTGSAAKIDAIVRELDNDGKLQTLFGKQGAEKIRDLRDVAIDIYTSPSGTVNSSNTSSALIRRFDDIAGYASGTPIIGKAVNYSAQAIKSAGTRRKVRQALNPNLNEMAGEKK